MSRLRPRPADWFELLCARGDLTRALAVLAGTGEVELEGEAKSAAGIASEVLRAPLAAYHRLAGRYRFYWPAPAAAASGPGEPVLLAQRALDRLHAWEAEATPKVERLEANRAATSELDRLGELAAALGDSPLELGQLASLSAPLIAGVWQFPATSRLPALPAGLVTLLAAQPHQFVIAVVPGESMETLERALAEVKARRVLLPIWLQGTATAAHRQIEKRRKALARERTALARRLNALARRHDLARVLADLEQVRWFAANVESLPASEHFVWVRGWTTDADGEKLESALVGAGIHALLRRSDPPPDPLPPLVFSNPPWARPFELFTRLLGMPGRFEADPTALLAFLIPLMFGYMFGDVGQGALLALAGRALGPRLPAARMLVPAGVSAMFFGLLYGSVFAREDLIPALWLHPLEQPLAVLLPPLAGGAVLLAGGLALSGVEAHWRGEGRRWWRADAGLPALYLGALAALTDRRALVIALAGAVWFVSADHWRRRLAALVESVFQLAVNTLSFARVGAFALAHAGLSAAVAALADGAGTVGFWLIMVAGNALVILLEGLVVSIQITRLVLFEFFIRFLRAEGRRFRPLLPPRLSPAPHPQHPGQPRL